MSIVDHRLFIVSLGVGGGGVVSFFFPLLPENIPLYARDLAS